MLWEYMINEIAEEAVFGSTSALIPFVWADKFSKTYIAAAIGVISRYWLVDLICVYTSFSTL